MNRLSAANESRLAEVRRGRAEIAECDRLAQDLPNWSTKPDLILLMQREPERIAAALIALRKMRSEPDLARPDQQFVNNLIAELEGIFS